MRREGFSATLLRRTPYFFGLVDWSLASATTLVLTVAAARALGPSGLGAVSIGFATVLVTLGLLRSFVLDPFLAAPASLGHREGTRTILTLAVATGALGGLGCALAGALLKGPLGAGLFAFSPYLPVVHLQEATRVAVYRQGKTGLAAAARMVWIIITTALLLALPGSVQTVVSAWGVGAFAAAALLISSLRIVPASPVTAVRLWQHRLRRLGAPMGLASVIDASLGQLETYAAAAVAGAAALGGFRAGMSAFAPLTLLRPALAQVGLPRIAGLIERDPQGGRRRAVAIAVVLLTASVVFATGAAIYGRLLPLVFGSDFATYSNLLLPLTVAQLLSAAGTGVHLWLLATQRGGVLLIGTAIAVPIRLVGTAVMGARFGASGLAWALVPAYAVAAVVGLIGAARPVKDVARLGSSAGEPVSVIEESDVGAFGSR